MGKTQEYLIKLNDQMSQVLDKLEGKTQKVDDSFSRLTGTIAKIGIGAMAFSATKSMITLGMEMEQTKTSFETMVGSVGKSNKLISELNNFANVTPFDNQTLFEGAKMMLNFGINVKDVLPNLKMLGDVSGGDAEKMKGLTYAFSQVQSTGRLMGQDLLQMINVGFNPLQEISKMTGESMAVLKDKMSKGAISADDVSKAFKHATSEGGMFYGMMDKQSKTLGGAWSTLMGTMQTSSLRLFDKLKPALTGAVNLFTKLANETLPKASEALEEERKQTNLLVAELTSSTTTYERRNEIYKQLQEMAPDVAASIKVEGENYIVATGALKKYNEEMITKIMLSKQDEGLQKKLDELNTINSRIAQVNLAIQSNIFGVIEKARKLSDKSPNAKKVAEYLEEMISMQGFSDVSRAKEVIRVLSEEQNKFLDIESVDDQGFKTLYSGLLSGSISAIDELTEKQKTLNGVYEDLKRKRDLIGSAYGGTRTETIDTKINKPTGEGAEMLTQITSAAPKIFNINIGSLINDFKIESNTIEGSTVDVKRAILEAMMEGLNDSQKIAFR